MPGRVHGIHTIQHFVQLQDGRRIYYHKLLLANGARPRHLSCSGLNLAGVSTLRTVADYQEILRRLSHIDRVVITGSGTLALESAETLRQRGYEVTHLLRGATLWSEVLDPVASDMVLQEERRDGIDVRTGEEIAEIVGKNGQVAAYNMLGLLSPGHPFYPGSPGEARATFTNYYNATFLYGLDFVSIGLTTRPSTGYQEIIAARGNSQTW